MKKGTWQIWGTIVVIALIGLLFAYCSSSASTDTSKADKLGAQSANSHIESIQTEANANIINLQADDIAKDREEAEDDFRTQRDFLRKKKVTNKKYEKARNSPVVVDTNALDARERRVLAELRELYK